MKKLILILLSFNVNLIFAQSKYTLEQAQNSNDPKVVANFIVNNPNHPKTTALKQKLAHMMMSKDTKTTTTSKNNHQKSGVRKNVSAENQKTAEILTHILNGNENSKEAYVAVKNLSRCPIVVHFNGKNKYTLNVGANSIGRLLVDKGNYQISSKICNAPYKNQRMISKDWELTLNTSR